MLQRVVVDPAQVNPPWILLTPEQQHYLSRVLRLTVDDRFIALDGQGHVWLTSLVLAPPDHLQARILESVLTQTELPIAVMLVMALPKGNAFDEVVRQVTELGVSCIAPVISDRTLLNPSSQKLERWQRIAQEAAEQSERQIVPTILQPASFTDHLKTINTLNPQPPLQNYLCVTRYPAPHLLTCLLSPSSFILHPSSPFLSTPHSPLPIPLTLTIGPEGGWTETEIEHAIAAGYQPVSLGSRILRTVTAPIAALSLIAAVCEQGIVSKG